MSIDHLAAVLYRMPELVERAPAFALIAIADSADRKSGWSFYITLREIAGAARVKQRAARACLRFLEERGYIRTEASGIVGRQRLRYRVLFDPATGQRRAELELYPPAAGTGVKKTAPKKAPAAYPQTTAAGTGGGPAAGTGGPAAGTGGPAAKDTPPNNPLIGVSVSSPSLIQRGGKNRGPKRIPEAEQARDLGPERERQTAELRRRMAATS